MLLLNISFGMVFNLTVAALVIKYPKSSTVYVYLFMNIRFTLRSIHQKKNLILI